MGITETSIVGIKLASAVINASGPKCAGYFELMDLAKSGAAAVMMKSCTILPRVGNPEPRLARIPGGMQQSMGLPNKGCYAYTLFADALKHLYPKKPVIASVAGLCADDFETMAKMFSESDADLIEINLSCPNVPGKPQVAYDFAAAESIIAKIEKVSSKPFGLKLPPYFDWSHWETVAKIINRYDVGFVSCINSVGNGLVIDIETEAPVIAPKDGFGGLSGRIIQPIALANVRAFRMLLRPEISIFGVGGIMNGEDAFKFILAGADAVQVATIFEIEGLGCFSRIDGELASILKRKGYASVSEAKGKLKRNAGVEPK